MTNPYYPTEGGAYVPGAFAGRSTAYAHINQHFADPTNPQAAAFMGGPHLGKSALLWHFPDHFDDTHIGVYLPLRQFQPRTEAEFLRILSSEIREVLRERSSFSDRLPDLPEAPGADLWPWLTDTFLPAVYGVIRPHRRVVLLLDDVHLLLAETRDGLIPPDIFQRWSRLLADHKQLAMALTLDEAQENAASQLAPLIDPTALYRLEPLNAEETRLLLVAMDGIDANDDAVQAVHKAAGGLPLLLQRVGYHLFEHMTQQTRSRINMGDVREVLLRAMQESRTLFQQQWDALTVNEQIVLHSTSELLYENPLTPVTPAIIEQWLAETDTPLDGTTARAAIRGLEYQFIVRHQGEGFVIAVGMMQTWLRAHPPRIQAAPRPTPSEAEPVAVSRSRVIIILTMVSIMLMLLVLLMWPTTQQPDVRPSPAAPTVTLEPPPG